MPDAHGRCVTCSDEALPVRVLAVDDSGWTAAVEEIGGSQREIDISLLDDVAPGQTLLVHGGVALGVLDSGY